MKLSVSEQNWPVRELGTALCANIQLVLISKFDFGPEKLPGLSRNGSLGTKLFETSTQTRAENTQMAK